MPADPLTNAAKKLALETGKSPLDHALGDGEDFELLIAMPEKSAQMLLAIQPLEGVLLHKIGYIIPEGVWLDPGNGDEFEPLGPLGFDHTLE